MVFSTGYGANLGLISGILRSQRNVCISTSSIMRIVDGAKLAFGKSERFNHDDMQHLTFQLRSQHFGGRGTMIVVDGIYSMEGDIANISELVIKIARQYGAALVVDDAHALGVLGPRGEGTGAHFRHAGRH